MIDPSEQRPISFSGSEQPELPEVSQVEIERDRQAREAQKQVTLDWLDTHIDFRPLGVEW